MKLKKLIIKRKNNKKLIIKKEIIKIRVEITVIKGRNQ